MSEPLIYKTIVAQVTTTTVHEVRLNKHQLLALMSGQTTLDGLPENTSNLDMFVEVPGGGDWSNTTLHFGSDSDTLLVLKWTNVS